MAKIVIVDDERGFEPLQEMLEGKTIPFGFDDPIRALNT